ncbi:dynamin family protein [Rhodobacteraceae bacterium B1Z28]|uniref:Dynamin family protein n=1 Tax=Ruegeria haliotis TaxID=2747601 RepID=A0ABX2PSN2_9RHOB|nr:dynamin family protein [Ruegeria haliotis]NVO56406.1 dynamin family protein [Ruegeria haliotis]
MAKDSQTRFVSPKAWERIEQWSRRKPVFALMGEFSAGKSTLINFLLRTQTLPTQVTATQLPPVWFSWGNQSAYVKRHDGSTEDIELDQLETVGVNDAQFIRIFLEADILEAVDLIDTPGISDPKISTDVWQRAVGQANGVLWCTHATQAWRETERATWVSLPERLQHNSLLLVTRADALGVKDRQKVLRRVNREAGHLFNRSILFSARDAITARDKTGDAEMWSRSGGAKMIDSFLEITEQIMDNRADQLARYQIDKSLSDAPKVEPLRPSKNADVPVSGQDAVGAEPLKLVNPLVEGTVADPKETAVVTSFPVRPARVERRADETERARIDAEEAERLRAEMVPADDIAPEVSNTDDDDLRAFFRDTSSDPLELTNIEGSKSEFEDIDLLDDADLDDDLEDTPLLLDEDEEGEPQVEEVEGAENLLASISTTLMEAPELEADEADPVVQPDERSIEVSVSSITALMAEQPGNAVEDYEPEPETNGLVETRGAKQSEDTSETQGDALDDLMKVPVGSPLSASAMWLEIANDADLPQDPEGLKNVFKAFLAEFDQIAVEHNERQTKDSLRSIPKASENSGAEWHVL